MGAGSAGIGIDPWSIFEWSIAGGGSAGAETGFCAVADLFFGGDFLTTAFFATGFFLTAGLAGIGIVIPPWPVCCATAGAASDSSASALDAANNFIFTDVLRTKQLAGASGDAPAFMLELVGVA